MTYQVRTYNNFDSNKTYEYGISVGYWLSGIKIDSEGNKKEISRDKSKKILLDSLSILSQNNKESLFIILDDCSPIQIEEIIEPIQGNPTIIVQLLQKLNPAIKVSYNKNGMPIIRWESMAFASKRIVPPSPLSMMIINQLKEKSGLII